MFVPSFSVQRHMAAEFGVSRCVFMSGDMSERMSEDMSDRMSEECQADVRRYVRKNVRNTVRKNPKSRSLVILLKQGFTKFFTFTKGFY